MTVRKMEPSDLGAVAEISKCSYKRDHFTSRFTLGMLRSYYKYILDLNHHAYVAEDGGRVVGFVIGGERTKEAIRLYLRRNVLKVSFIMLLNPSFIIPKATSLFPSKPSRDSGAKMRLLSIAVSCECEGTGVGARLIECFESGLADKGIGFYGLSVHKSNLRAVRFYEKMGYRKEFETDGAVYYIKDVK